MNDLLFRCVNIDFPLNKHQVAALLGEVQTLSTSCAHLDDMLKGGLQRGSLTEVGLPPLQVMSSMSWCCACFPSLHTHSHSGASQIVGPPGCGKTQFCIMLAIQAWRLSKPALYIDTEGAFSAERLVEMASSRFPEELAAEDALFKLTQTLRVWQPKTCQELTTR